MNNEITHYQLMAMCNSSSVSDQKLVAAFRRVITSQNAHAAGAGLFELACYVGHYRPNCFLAVLRQAMEPMVAVGIQSPDEFWEFVHFAMRRSNVRWIRWLKTNLGGAAQKFYYRHLPDYQPSINQILAEVVREAYAE